VRASRWEVYSRFVRPLSGGGPRVSLLRHRGCQGLAYVVEEEMSHRRNLQLTREQERRRMGSLTSRGLTVDTPEGARQHGGTVARALASGGQVWQWSRGSHHSRSVSACEFLTG
jgi:hypothetical protein